MKVSVREASKQYGTPFPFSLSETLAPITYGGRELILIGPAEVSGTVTGDGKSFTVCGEGHVVFTGQCDRCLEQYEKPFSFSFEERFVREEAEDEDSYPYCGDELDIGQAFLDNMLLSMPMINLCREDCLGLCPQCGANLNHGTCGCLKPAKNSAFDILRSLSFDNKEV